MSAGIILPTAPGAGAKPGAPHQGGHLRFSASVTCSVLPGSHLCECGHDLGTQQLCHSPAEGGREGGKSCQLCAVWRSGSGCVSLSGHLWGLALPSHSSRAVLFHKPGHHSELSHRFMFILQLLASCRHNLALPVPRAAAGLAPGLSCPSQCLLLPWAGESRPGCSAPHLLQLQQPWPFSLLSPTTWITELLSPCSPGFAQLTAGANLLYSPAHRDHGQEFAVDTHTYLQEKGDEQPNPVCDQQILPLPDSAGGAGLE